MAKKRTSLFVLFGLVLLVAPSAWAQKYYLNLTATCRSTNSAGTLVNSRLSAPGLLNEIIPDPTVARGHCLVFDSESGEVQIIYKGTGEVLDTLYVFTLDTSVSNVDGTRSEAYWTISCPLDAGYQGSAVGTVILTRGLENEITRFKVHGKFVLRHQPAGEGRPRVYSGVFTTGARYVAPTAP
jgi:hypothetical protein